MFPIRTRWRQSSGRAMSSFPTTQRTDDGFVDLSSRTRADTLSFSVVLVHETSEIKTTRAGAAFGSDHYRSAFESATGALPGTCNFGTTDVYTTIGPT